MPLSDKGERQACALAARLAAEPLDAIHSSPRLRARQTAEAIAGTRGLGVEIAGALDEIDFGDWTGKGFAELEHDPCWHEWNAARGAARCPGGESMAEAADRALAHARGLTAAAAGARIALISHGDTLRGLVARVLGLPLDNLLRFEIAPASVSRIEIGASGGRVLGLNDRSGIEQE